MKRITASVPRFIQTQPVLWKWIENGSPTVAVCGHITDPFAHANYQWLRLELSQKSSNSAKDFAQDSSKPSSKTESNICYVFQLLLWIHVHADCIPNSAIGTQILAQRKDFHISIRADVILTWPKIIPASHQEPESKHPPLRPNFTTFCVQFEKLVFGC